MNNHNWIEAIPASKHSAIAKAFQTAFGTTQIDDIAPLTGGRSSALVFKVQVEGKAYVLRLVLEVDALRDPQRHFRALNSASAAGIAPPVRYTNADEAISIVDFIESAPLATGFPDEASIFSALGCTIKAIHELPLFPPLVEFIDGVDALNGQFKASALLPEAATAAHFERYDLVRQVYPRHQTDLVSSHNDLNPTNVLHQNGRLWIIDWEVAFAGDRYLDLASANIFYGAGERGEEVLLQTYFGESLSDYHRARFFLMQQVCFFYIAMLFMHLVGLLRGPDTILDSSMETLGLKEFHALLKEGKVPLVTAEDHLVFSKVMLNESLAQMRSARFEEALHVLSSAQIQGMSVSQPGSV